MIATLRQLDSGWQLSTSHGVDLFQTFATRGEAEAAAIKRCKTARAWPLALDVITDPHGRTIAETLLIGQTQRTLFLPDRVRVVNQTH